MCCAQPLDIHLPDRLSGDFQFSANVPESVRDATHDETMAVYGEQF